MADAFFSGSEAEDRFTLVRMEFMADKGLTVEHRTQRLAALFALGCLLFNYPLLALFNRPALLGGVPLLYVYVFAAWALLIGLLALVIEKK